MTEQEIAALGPAFAAYLRRFRGCFGQDRTAGHFDTYCRGLLSDLPRKTRRADRPGRRDRRPHPPGVPGHRRGGTTTDARDTLQRRLAAVARRAAGRPARDGRGDRRDELPQDGGPDARGAAAVPGVRRQDRQRHRDRPRRGGQGRLPGPARRRPVPAEVVGRRPRRGAGRPASRTTSATGRSGGSRWTSWSGWAGTGCRSTGWCSTRGTGRRCRSCGS